MKKLFLALILIGLTFSSTAQDNATCIETAQAASGMISNAQDLLAGGNVIEASTLLDSATLLLDNCGAIAATESPSASATLAESGNPVEPSLYTLTAPTVIEENSIAFVRFAHTSVDIGPLDIYMGNANVLIVSNLLFGDFTEFVPINGGEISFLARRHDAGADSEVLSRLSWNFVGNSSWIVSAVGVAETRAFSLEPISVLRNEYNEQARIRVVNFMAGAPRLTITTDSLVLANGLAWIGIQDTFVAVGTYNLQISSDNEASSPQVMSFDFEANSTYTLYAIGQGTAEQPLQILNIISQADISYVQFINQTDAALDLHYRPSNMRLVENLGIDDESSWFTLPSGAYTFISYAPNTGTTGQELAAISIQLRPQRYLVFEISGTEMRLISESLTEGGE